MSGTTREMRSRRAARVRFSLGQPKRRDAALGITIILIVLVAICALVGTAYGHPVVPVEGTTLARAGFESLTPTGTPSVNDTLRAFAKLQSFGYRGKA